MNTIEFNIRDLFPGIADPQFVKDYLSLTLGEQTYTPKVDNSLFDWVSRVAMPAFQASKETLGGRNDVSFCSIGTGSGTDALAAIETFAPATVALTDLYAAVVDAAVVNVKRNLTDKSARTQVLSATGDLAEPLVELQTKFDVLYENLPNIPLPNDDALHTAQNSSSYHVRRRGLPKTVELDLLALHYKFLLDAKPFIKPDGFVLCSIGARRPIANIIEMVELAGYVAEPLTYTWKLQSEYGEVVSGYAGHEAAHGTDFTYHSQETLERVFGEISPQEAAAQCFEIEAALDHEKVTSTQVLKAKPDTIAHTVVVVKAIPK